MDCQTNLKKGEASVRCGVNLLKTEDTTVNATGHLSHSRTHDQFGAGLNMQSGGNSAALGVNRVPQFNETTMQATGKANIYTSPSGNFNLDASGSGVRHMSGPLRGKSDFEVGLQGRYKF